MQWTRHQRWGGSGGGWEISLISSGNIEAIPTFRPVVAGRT